MTRRFDAVFFDLGQTLVCPRGSFPELFREVCAEHEVILAAEEVSDLLSLIEAEIGAEQARGGAFSRSAAASRRFWTRLYRRVLGERLGAYPEHLPQALYDRFRNPMSYQLYPDVLPTLTALRAAGARLAIISNWEAWAVELIERLGLAPFFDVAVISGVVGVEKPNPRLFHLAMEGVGVPPERAAHVGDHPAHDCDAAHAVGISPILLDRYGRHPVSPWPRIERLEGFVEQVLFESTPRPEASPTAARGRRARSGRR